MIGFIDPNKIEIIPICTRHLSLGSPLGISYYSLLFTEGTCIHRFIAFDNTGGKEA